MECVKSAPLHICGKGALYDAIASPQFLRLFPDLHPIWEKPVEPMAHLVVQDRLPTETEEQEGVAHLSSGRSLISVFPLDGHILAIAQKSLACAKPSQVLVAWKSHKPKNQWPLIEAWRQREQSASLKPQAFQALIHVLQGFLRALVEDCKSLTSNLIHCFSLANQQYSEIPVYPGHQAADMDLFSQLARGELEPARKKSPGNFRMKPLPDLASFLEENTHPAFGLIQKCVLETEHRFYAPVRTSFLEYSHGTGHDLTFHKSMNLAVLEALERMAGATPRKPVPRTKKSYRDLEGEKVDPLAIGLMDDYQHPINHFFPDYDENLAIAWTQAYNLTTQKRTWLAEQFAYHDPKYLDLPAMVFDTSNGCAAGGHPLEAIFFGLLEVIERDAFNMVWYNRLACESIALESIEDLECQMLAGQLAMEGNQIHLFRLPTDVPVSVVLVVMMRPSGELGTLTIGTCAHPNPRKAIHNAFMEALYHFSNLEGQVLTNLENLREKAAHFDQVESLGDHVSVFGLPEMATQVQFLFGDSAKPIEALNFPAFPAHDDLAEDVAHLVNWLQREGYDVLIHDQTSPEQTHLGLNTIKVLVPGFLPVSFGTNRQRIKSLPRLRDVPVKLGLRDTPITNDAINKAPHPLS